MGGFNLNIPLSFNGITITPQQIQNAVAAQNAQPAQTLTEAVAAMPAQAPAATPAQDVVPAQNVTPATVAAPAPVATTSPEVGKAGGVVSAGSMGLPGLSDLEVATSLGLEYTGDRDQDQMVQDAVEQARASEFLFSESALSDEELAQRTQQFEDTIAQLQTDKAMQEQWFGERDTRKFDLSPADILKVAASFAIPYAAPLITGGGMLSTMLTQAALGGGLAAATGEDPIKGALSSAFLTNPAQASAGTNLGKLAKQTAEVFGNSKNEPAPDAQPASVVEQVFADVLPRPDYTTEQPTPAPAPSLPVDITEPPLLEPDIPTPVVTPPVKPTPTPVDSGGGGGAQSGGAQQPAAPTQPEDITQDTTAPEGFEPVLPPSYSETINNVLEQLDVFRQEGQSSTQAVQDAVDSVASSMDMTREELLGELGTTQENILADIAVRDETLRGEMEAGQAAAAEERQAIIDQVAANEEAGMTRDDALQEAINAVAAANNTTREDLLGQLGATEETLAGQIETLSETAATERQAIIDEVRANEAAGMERTDALQAAIDAIAEANNTTREDLLAEMGTSQEAILTEVNTQLEGITGSIEGLQGGVTRNEELIGAVNDRLDQYVAEGQTRADALEQAVADVAAQTDQSFMDVLGYLGDLQENVNVDVENVRVAGEEGRQAILDQVVANEAAGMERDAALDEAIAGVADSLGVAVEDLLSQMGTNRSELEGAIGTLEQQVADVQTNVLEQVAANEQAGMDRDAALETAVNKVSEQLGVTREGLLEQLGATEETLSGRIGELQTSVEQQVADAQASVLEQVAANEEAGMARDEALDEAIATVADNLDVAVEDLLSQMGTNRSELETLVTEGQQVLEEQITQSQETVLEEVRANEAAGQSRDEALSNALEGIAADLGVAVSDILSQVNANEAAGMARDQAIGEAIGGMGQELGSGLMSVAAEVSMFQPKWNELFQYTTLKPYQKKAITPFAQYITQAKGMLS